MAGAGTHAPLRSQAYGIGGGIGPSGGAHAAPHGLPSHGFGGGGQDGAVVTQAPVVSQTPGVTQLASQRAAHGSRVHAAPQTLPLHDGAGGSHPRLTAWPQPAARIPEASAAESATARATASWRAGLRSRAWVTATARRAA
jgi:hypothetical protein